MVIEDNLFSVVNIEKIVKDLPPVLAWYVILEAFMEYEGGLRSILLDNFSRGSVEVLEHSNVIAFSNWEWLVDWLIGSKCFM